MDERLAVTANILCSEETKKLLAQVALWAHLNDCPKLIPFAFPS